MTIQTGRSGATNHHHRGFDAPTESQMAALQRYAGDTDLPEPVRDGIKHYITRGLFSYSMASQTIGMIKGYLAKDLNKPVEVPGIYVDPKTGAFYLVKKSQLGRLYALDLIIHDPGERGLDGGWERRPSFEWVFQSGKGIIYKLDASWKATPEQVKQWGDLFGQCIRCLADLTVQKSIDQGMGDTCFKKQFS